MKKQNILVTGARGFLGNALCFKLNARGYNVIGIDKEEGDISKDLPSFKNIHHVFHLAALTYVVDSWISPAKFYEVNLMGTLNVLEFCRKNNISVTYFSSYVYGTPEKLPIDEKHPLKSGSPYGQSKVFADELCQFYLKNYGMNITIVRPFNVYGPNQNILFLIPKIFTALFDKNVKTIELYSLWPKRDMIYIDDIINAVVELFEKRILGIFNVGSGYSLSIEEMLKIILSVTGISKEYIVLNDERKNEIPETVADISKLKNAIGWSPQYTFEQGIEKIFSIYK